MQERSTLQSPQQEAHEMLNVPLGTLIFRAGLLSQEDLQEALAASIRDHKMLGEVLLERGMVEERELGRLLAGQKGLPFVDLDRINVDHDVARRLSETVAREHSALPVAVDPQGTPLVAVVNPSPAVVAAVAQAFGSEPHVGVAARGELLRTIELVYGASTEQPSLRLADAEEVEQEAVVEPVAEQHVVEEPQESAAEEIPEAGLSPLRIEPWGRAAEDEPVDEPAEHDADEDSAVDEADDGRIEPTASLAEAPEPFDEETHAEEDASEPVDDEKPIFPWAGPTAAPTEELVVESTENEVDDSAPFEAASDEPETTDSFADAPHALGEDVVELEASTEPVLATEHDEGEEELTDESVQKPVAASTNGWDPGASFGEQPLLALVAAEDEPEAVEHSFDDAESPVGVAAVETDAETEVVDEDVAEATDEAVVDDGALELVEPATDEAVLDDEALELDDSAPVAEEVAEDDADDHVADDAVEAEAAAEVFLTLANGERLSSGRFASEREAVGHAQSLLSDLRREWWPKVGTRLIRPGAVISIDLETE